MVCNALSPKKRQGHSDPLNAGLFGQIQADQSSSFQATRQLLQQFVTLVGEDPAVDNVLGFTGGGYGGSVNTARMFVAAWITAPATFGHSE